MNRIYVQATFTVLAGLMSCSMASGAEFPDRSIRMVVPYPAGGSTDIAARAIANAVSLRLNQQVVVENRPGAGAMIGASAVARAEPDGYTLLYAATSVSLTPLINTNTDFNFQRDLAPVSMTLAAPLVLLANPTLPAKSVTDLLDAMRSAPEPVKFGFPGMGSVNHLASIHFNDLAGVQTLLVPYKGNSDSLLGLLRGDVSLAFDAIMSSKAHIESGAVNALAVSSSTRSSVLPNVPTISEQELEGFDVIFWNGVFAPSGTPETVIALLNAAFDAVLQAPEMKEKLRDLGAEPAGGTTAQFQQQINNDLENWGRIIREQDIRAQ